MQAKEWVRLPEGKANMGSDTSSQLEGTNPTDYGVLASGTEWEHNFVV